MTKAARRVSHEGKPRLRILIGGDTFAPEINGAATFIARLAAGLAERCQVQVSYAIGVAKPTSIMATTFGTGRVSDEKIEALIARHFDLRPKGIVQMLDLLRPIYEKTAAYGHFGRTEPEFTWERTDKAEALRVAAGLEAVAV